MSKRAEGGTLVKPDPGAPEEAVAPSWVGALTGLVVTALALSVGHVAAVLTTPDASPVITVGQTFIDATPEWLKSFAIRTFGSNDKRVLLAGIFGVIAVGSVAIGVLAIRRRWIGYAGLGALTAIGIATALGRPSATAVWIVPSLVAGAAGVGAFMLLSRTWGPATGAAPRHEGARGSGGSRRIRSAALPAIRVRPQRDGRRGGRTRALPEPAARGGVGTCIPLDPPPLESRGPAPRGRGTRRRPHRPLLHAVIELLSSGHGAARSRRSISRTGSSRSTGWSTTRRRSASRTW